MNVAIITGSSGDTPNFLPLIELENRYDIAEHHICFNDGIDEDMSIGNRKHSVFGAGKVAADSIVQEYGKPFLMNTGANYSGVQLHGLLPKS